MGRVVIAVLLVCVCTAIIALLRTAEMPKKPRADIAQGKQYSVVDAFNNMTPAQHLVAAQEIAEPYTSVYQIDEGLWHLGAIQPSAAEAGRAKALEQKLMAARKKLLAEIAKAQAEADRSQALVEAKAKRLLRDRMAKSIENSMLDQSYNADVSAIGNDHTVLHLKWALVSKAMAHQFSERSDFFESARAAGFKRIEITDGYDQAWYWDLR